MGRIPGIGAVALGGVGIYLPINILFMAVSLLFGGGGAPQAAIALGAGDRKKAEKYLGCCLLPLIVCGVVFSFSLLVLPAVVNPAYSVLAVYGAQAITDVAGVLFIVMLYRRERKG